MAPTTYLLLFRGVGGATQLPVAPLRTALAEAGFQRVATYINSGNAVVDAPWDRATVLAKVAALCRDRFGFTKDIHVPTAAEWEAVVTNNPYPHMAQGKDVHAAWLAGIPTAEALAALRAMQLPGEELRVIGTVAYLHTPHGFGTSKFAAAFDKLIGVPNTARNWNTVLKLHALAQASGPRR